MGTYHRGELLEDRYRILKELGQGGSGTTYAAEDLTQQGKTVAIKVLRFEDLDNWKVLELFEREANVLAQLTHPSIPRYIDSFQIETEQDLAFHIVQERAQGKSLSTWIEEGWRCDEKTLRAIAKQVLEILMYLKTFDPPVIHRDIKPHNIIRRNDGKIFLVDFGAVRDTYYSTLMHGSTMVGTYGYMAPEQFQGHAYPSTDLYGLGATLLFLLTKRPPAELPHDGLNVSFRGKVNVSAHFADWLEKLLEPDVDDRFSSPQNAFTALLKPPSKKVQPRTKLPLWTAFAGGACAILFALWVVNAHKWRILGTAGIEPSGLCTQNSTTLPGYLREGGDPDLLVKKRFYIVPSGARMDDNGLINAPLLLCDSTPEVIAMLLEYGADPNQKVGRIPILHFAISSENYELARQLIEHGADVNFSVRYHEGGSVQTQSILHRAVEEGDLGVVKALVNQGAVINAEGGRFSETPLDVARRKYEVEIGQFLEANGAIANKYEARW